jgi:hypothetical protein
MKKLLLFATMLAIHNGIHAQLTLTKAANEPVSGDSWTTKKFDSTVVVPKNTGTGQTWNFNTFTATTQTNVTTYTTAASTPGYSLFPGSTLANLKGGSEVGYFKSAGSNWEFMGFYDNSGPTVLTLTNTGVFATWPISYGSTLNDFANGTMTSGTMTINFSGTVSTNASGAGTVILPGGNTFTNCLLVVQSVSLSIGTDSQFEKIYSFYHSSSKFPIAEYNYQTSISGTVTNTSFNMEVSLPALTTGLNDLDKIENQILVYPNPAKDWIRIDGLTEAAVEISDITGKILIKENLSDAVNTKGLSPGLYIIKISSERGTVTKRFIVQD